MAKLCWISCSATRIFAAAFKSSNLVLLPESLSGMERKGRNFKSSFHCWRASERSSIAYTSSLPLIADLHSVDYCGKVTLRLLCSIGNLQRPPWVSVKNFSLEGLSDIGDTEAVNILCSVPAIKHLGFRETRQLRWVGSQELLTPEDVHGIMMICPNLESLDLMIEPRRALAIKHPSVDHHAYDLKQSNAGSFLQLKELQLSGSVFTRNQEDCLRLLTAFSWPSMERLSLSGGSLIECLLPRFGAELTSLRSLRITFFPLHSNGSWAAPEQTLSAVSEFLATKSMVELELDGFGKDLPIRFVASMKLRKLRLHQCEIGATSAQVNLRSAHEIRELAKMAPNVEHLMLDVGQISKLWHPTAIPGVDVDVHLYQIFDALSTLPHLKILHLFPRFCTHNDNGRVLWRQAIEDDGQAVRIFKHLKAIHSSIEVLILSSDNVVARLADIDPMSWTVCQIGDTILLRVRQANKDYEQKQIWQGQRRLRTEIKRRFFSDPCLDGLGPSLPLR